MEETFIKEHSKSSTRIYPQYESSSRDVSQDGQGYKSATIVSVYQ